MQGLPHLHLRHRDSWQVFFVVCGLEFSDFPVSFMMPRGCSFSFYFCSWEGNSISDFTLCLQDLLFKVIMCLLLIFYPKKKVKGIMSTILFNSELVRFPDKEDLPKQQLLGAFPQPWHTRGRIFTGEMAQLPGSYHHRLPMLREQTAHYPSCRCLPSPRRKSRSQCPKMVGSARDRACPWYTPPTASMSTHELLSYPESIWGGRRGEGRC